MNKPREMSDREWRNFCRAMRAALWLWVIAMVFAWANAVIDIWRYAHAS